MSNAVSKLILNINDHPDIRALFAGFRAEEVADKYTNGGQIREGPQGIDYLQLVIKGKRREIAVFLDSNAARLRGEILA